MRNRVKTKTWDAFQYTAGDGRPAQEAAEILGLKVATVYKAKSSVLRMLQEELRKLEDGCDVRDPK